MACFSWVREGRTETPVNLASTKSPCEKIGDEMFGGASSGKKNELYLRLIESSAKAECELKYRIKQQEANKLVQVDRRFRGGIADREAYERSSPEFIHLTVTSWGPVGSSMVCRAIFGTMNSIILT